MAEPGRFETEDEVLRLEGVRKSYNTGLPTEAEVLHGIDLALTRGDFAALIGPSGSGKSTLLNLIGLLDQPTRGRIHLLKEPTEEMSDAELTARRAETIGFVFQFHHLIPAFTALENVLMPLMLRSGKPDDDAIAWAPAATAIPSSCPADSSSGSRSRARWRPVRHCCLPTNRPEISIR
jgi:lipoprotein-releasing system ATP-binding protein